MIRKVRELNLYEQAEKDFTNALGRDAQLEGYRDPRRAGGATTPSYSGRWSRARRHLARHILIAGLSTGVMGQGRS